MSKEELTDLLDQIFHSIQLVSVRFSRIDTPDELVSSPEGVTLLDAISMRLQVIGESVKRIQKISPSYLEGYSDIEWFKIAKFRDLVSHHYEHVDHEIIYDICKVHIPILKKTVEKMHSDISENDIQ